ncbi:DUF3604 domain-containing protein [Shimia sp. W99]
MRATRHSLILALGLLAGPVFAQDFTVQEDEFPAKPPNYSPYVEDSFPQNVYFGDTHLHTAWSADSGLAGGTPGPDDAYRVSRGEVFRAQSGHLFKLIRPLDFVVISDHAENIGLSEALNTADPLVMATEYGRRWAEMRKDGRGYEAFLEFLQSSNARIDRIDSPDLTASIWSRVIENAERYYQPGVFTTFVAYEWTSAPGGNNLHRNVIFRDGASRAQQVLPFSTYDSDDPEDLWAYMAAYEDKTGGRVLAIPHNGNLSNGMMFMTETFSGEAFSADYASLRARYEPLVEMTQIKGTGEAHPLLSPDDQFADFELLDAGNIEGTAFKTPEMLRTEYTREALKIGLAEKARLGVNPFKFGMVGSTDAHASIPSSREENWFGKGFINEPNPDRNAGVLVQSLVDDRLSIRDVDLGASGLAAVWATENTREAIWDAMARKEVFATTGTRLRVRLFAGWDFTADEVTRPDFAKVGYDRGVPMGADLFAGPDGAAPTLMIRALRDPDGANLDRIQVVKGWLDASGETHETIYDVACAGREVVQNACAGEVGSTVNIAEASYQNTIGGAMLSAHWRDPDFDPDQHAFYYVRVLEIPTPRWTAYDAKFFDVEMPAGTAMTVQDRAYTSPIWYSPEG